MLKEGTLSFILTRPENETATHERYDRGQSHPGESTPMKGVPLPLERHCAIMMITEGIKEKLLWTYDRWNKHARVVALRYSANIWTENCCCSSVESTGATPSTCRCAHSVRHNKGACFAATNKNPDWENPERKKGYCRTHHTVTVSSNATSIKGVYR